MHRRRWQGASSSLFCLRSLEPLSFRGNTLNTACLENSPWKYFKDHQMNSSDGCFLPPGKMGSFSSPSSLLMWLKSSPAFCYFAYNIHISCYRSETDCFGPNIKFLYDMLFFFDDSKSSSLDGWTKRLALYGPFTDQRNHQQWKQKLIQTQNTLQKDDPSLTVLSHTSTKLHWSDFIHAKWPPWFKGETAVVLNSNGSKGQ